MKTIFARINWFYDLIIIFIGLTLKIITWPFVPKPYGSKIASCFIHTFMFNPVRTVGKIDPDAQMLIANHQSDIDISSLECSTKRDLVWVAKKELFSVPFFGLAIRISDDIPVDRDSKAALVSLVRESKKRIDQGRCVVMFPEGTRSNGKKMRPFKPGAKMVADTHGLRVQPVVLINTARYFDLKNRSGQTGPITVVYLDSFVASKDDANWLSDLQVKMQIVYDEYLAKLDS
ncbi:lysophospholipid acyltransferase family protein [Sulfurimonas sp. HSL3-7]|uniref:lysophospholipid acyltransferase family protein n=1 Tax=Sulfonitrofixus jiaomeiensis TaxID=3131938 RepID=UPI0031F936B7